VKEAIFTGTAFDGGAKVAFVSLTDGRCALIRDGLLVAAWATDAYGIDDGARQYLQLIQHPPLASGTAVVGVKRPAVSAAPARARRAVTAASSRSSGRTR
jgi:hypothetical protein